MKTFFALVVAILIAGLVVFLVGPQVARVSPSYSEARGKVDGLSGHHDIELVRNQVWDVSSVLGSRAEKSFRTLFGLKQRETPARIEDFYFRDARGEFIVQLLDQKGERLEISVYTKSANKDPSKATFAILHRTFPSANFMELP